MGRYSQPKIPMFSLALIWDNSSCRSRDKRFCAWTYEVNLKLHVCTYTDV